ncbi:MAG: cupin domain-containing protein [Spirosomataceae bacterium]
MPFERLDEQSSREVFPGWQGRMIHGNSMTVVHYRAKAGSPFSKHSHPHEQISNVIEGELELTINDETRLCKAGDVAVIPPHAIHYGKALTDCYVVDVFSPVREDYR